MPAIHLRPGQAAIIGTPEYPDVPGASIRVKLGAVNAEGDGGVTLHVGCGDAPVSIESADGSVRPLSSLRAKVSTAAGVKRLQSGEAS